MNEKDRVIKIISDIINHVLDGRLHGSDHLKEPLKSTIERLEAFVDELNRLKGIH